MLRHVSMLRWKDPSLVDAGDLAGRFKGLADKIPGIVRISAGADRKLMETNSHFVLIVDFQDEADWRFYNTNPHHWEIIEQIKSNLAERRAVQFEVEA